MSDQSPKLNIMTVPFKVMSSNRLTIAPTVALLFKLDIDTTGGELNISYPRAKRVSLSTAYPMAELLKDIASPRFNFNAQKKEEPYNSALSIRNNELAYIVFKLAGKKKLQFSNSDYLFSVGSSAPDALFGEAHKVDGQGKAHVPGSNAIGCQVAYFAMDGQNANPTDLANGMPFNIHLDFISKSKRPDQPSVDSLVPFILDPDIRYPGGTYGDEIGGGEP